MSAIAVKVLKPFSCGGRYYSPFVDPFLWVSPEMAEDLCERGLAKLPEGASKATGPEPEPTPAEPPKRPAKAKRAPRKGKK